MENHGIEQVVVKKRFKSANRPMPQRMCELLSKMAHGSTKSDFLNTLSANLVIFCMRGNYPKDALKERIDSLYTFFETHKDEQSR